MKKLSFLIVLFSVLGFGQNIAGIQVFNPETNDETPIITMGQQLILRFDDLDNSNTTYRYTLKHFDRNWQDDGLFFTQYAEGTLNDLLNNYTSSFNTYQAYTHYELRFPNNRIRPKLSGNYKIIVYKDNPSQPLFTRRFVVVEQKGNTAIGIERLIDSRLPDLNQRLQIRQPGNPAINQNLQSVTISVMQNNNWYTQLSGLRPSTVTGNDLIFQQMDLAFPGNNQFYFFDDSNLKSPTDMVAQISTATGRNEVLLFPVLAYPLNYQYQPDVNGAFYFRRNDNGDERDANTEGDYAWVYFSLHSDPIPHRNLYILGKFNEYQPTENSKMHYDADRRQYVAKIYLKQGFYNYILATDDGSGNLNLGEINGNFWQTTNLYQVITYYHAWSGNYDGAAAYGELRPKN